MSDVIALDQLFLLGKLQECGPNFPQNTVFQYIFQYTRVISWCLTLSEVQHYPSGLHKKAIRGRGSVWEGS